MHFIADNLRFIRKQAGLTQDQLAKKLGVKRSLIGAYEERRADPRISFLLHVCEKFGYTMDDLVGRPLDGNLSPMERASGSSLRILPIAVDTTDREERITLVPVKAAAGYLNGFGDVEFIESLPVFDLPFPEVSKGKTYRVFQVNGDSMLPIPSGAYIMGSYVMDWNRIKNDELYIIVSRGEGIVFKRVLNELKSGYLTLKSDNPAYDPFQVDVEDIAEVWKAEGMTMFGFDEWKGTEQDALLREIREIRDRLDEMNKKKEA
jgi:transcriptional regulator with XRE-family HTH domain